MPSFPCPCCGQFKSNLLLDLGSLPLSGIFFFPPPPLPQKAPLLLENCLNCNFVRKAKLPGAQRSYEFIDRDTVSQIFPEVMLCPLMPGVLGIRVPAGAMV